MDIYRNLNKKFALNYLLAFMIIPVILANCIPRNIMRRDQAGNTRVKVNPAGGTNLTSPLYSAICQPGKIGIMSSSSKSSDSESQSLKSTQSSKPSQSDSQSSKPTQTQSSQTQSTKGTESGKLSQSNSMGNSQSSKPTESNSSATNTESSKPTSETITCTNDTIIDYYYP